MRLCLGKVRLRISHQPLAPHRAKDGLGSLWLHLHCFLAGGLRSLKPTPNVFCLREKADLEGMALFAQAPTTHP